MITGAAMSGSAAVTWLLVPVLFGVAWGLVIRVAIWLLRPRMGRARPSERLLDTPPAVVNLLAHGLVDAPDAASATLLDLAERGYVELRDQSNDPSATMVVARKGLPRGLTAYELRVMQRVLGAGRGRPATLAQLAAGLAADGGRWHQRMVDEVRTHARELGLIRRAEHWSGWISGIGMVVGMFLGDAFGGSLLRLFLPGLVDDAGAAGFLLLLPLMFMGIMLVWWSMHTVGGRLPEEVPTPLGRQITGHWAGVRRYLLGYEAFADLPPAAVTVWGRYLPYGVALGAAPTAAAAVDLGTGRSEQIAVRRGGRWQLVPVRYPKAQGGLRSGTAGFRCVSAAVVLAALGALVAARGVQAMAQPRPARSLLILLGAVVVGWAGYRLVRAGVDLLTPVQVTGRVVRLLPVGTFDAPARAVAGRRFRDVYRRVPTGYAADDEDDMPAAEDKARAAEDTASATEDTASAADDTTGVPAYHVVVDDGRSAALRAWAVPAPRMGPLRLGRRVRMRGQRWTGYATRVRTVDEPPGHGDPLSVPR
jgi:hypothetical protein